ncbi:hypothetical protein [Streptomyces sp. NPDC057002]
MSDELTVVSRARPSISVQRIDATHPMILEAPEAVAGLVAGFVRALPG